MDPVQILIGVAHAGALEGAAQAGDALGGISADGFGGIFMQVASGLRALVTIVAFAVIVRAGLQMIAELQEDQGGKSKRAITGALVAIVLANIADGVSTALFSGVSLEGTGTNLEAAGTNIGLEIEGFFGFIEIPIAALAVLMIVVSGIKAVTKYGSEEGLTQLRHTVFSVLFGMVLIASKVWIATDIIGSSTGGTRTPDNFIGVITNIVAIILGFVALGAVITIIYAGIIMVLGIGKEEQYSRGKAIIVRVLIGLVVIVSSVAIAYTFLGF